MNGEFSVEALTRWDAVSLLRLLARHHAWSVQLGETRWVVSGRADTEEARGQVEAIVAQWARERGRPDLMATLVDETALLRGPRAVQ